MPREQENGAVVTDALGAVAGRLRVRAGLRTLAIAITVGVLCWSALAGAGLRSLAAAVVSVTAIVLLSAARLGALRSRWTLAAAAGAIERAYPASRNVVITAEELLRYPERSRSWVVDRVLERAAPIAMRVDRSAVTPLRKDVGFVLLAAVVAVLVVVGLPQRAFTTARDVISSDRTSDSRPNLDSAIEATITPPAYIGEPARTIRNPERIDAVQGSRLRLAISGGPWRARFGTTPLAAGADGNRAVFDLPLQQSGYVAIDAGDDRTSGRRRLVPIAVVPDRAPSIRITAPAKDLLLPDAKRTVAVEASAMDDFGLHSLELRYTKVSGTGEQFEFHEGSIPLSLSPQNDRVWNARAALALSRLALAPGDSIIYRILGRDRRPGDEGTASSDTYFIEIAGPGQVALEAFEMPPDRERYALSQQMIVLKLERLRARERALDRAALENEIANIAAEQRAVRANFIFLTGGTVEDEEQEAEHSHEIQEGRLENTARREIVAAIQFMSRAEQGMAAVSTAAALPPAKAAVEALQRAFGRNRYFLRTVPVRSRVDPSRRLSGETSTAADWRRELFPVPFDGPHMAARTILARLLDLSHGIRDGSLPPAALTAIAEETIAVEPSSAEWQGVSKSLLHLRDTAKEDSAARAALLGNTVSAVARIVQRTSVPIRRTTRDGSVRSAWSEERRR